ncbi:MAG: dicarboxylate/amino acid:cation symporter [Phascolarctobacterium sp.]|nr:dicarboxylate/amino acid:cation symporter [Phascolarctobacterium sp.]MBR5486604.1 dicarboxylate/amino acid:cation symporter [Phascolarctobacterium sp.]MBR6510713.1 dicarboxylate/amino acid:cation symporter [Phascolarctobacterium sp.]
MNLSTKILIALGLGIIAGLQLGAEGAGFAKAWIGPLGTIFMNLIKMVIVPLVFSSLVMGVCGLGDVKKLGRIGIKTIALYLITTAFAIALGIAFGVLVEPGAGLNLSTEGLKVATKTAPPIMKVIIDIFPTNPLGAMVKANMLQIILFALFIGVGIVAVGEKAEAFKNTIDGLAEVCYKMVGIIMSFAPFGVFGLITPVVAANGPAVLLPLLKVIICVYAGCAIHAFVVYGAMVAVMAKKSPMEFFRGIAPASLLAFSSCSSSGTLPLTMDCMRKMGVSKNISSFVLPLGATINMDGTALYQGVCALFVAQIYGVELTGAQYMTIMLTGTLASIGTAGVPGAGFIMLTMILTSLGLPLEGSALIAGIDRILDMPRTSVNVTGDAAVTLVVDKSEEGNA